MPSTSAPRLRLIRHRSSSSQGCMIPEGITRSRAFRFNVARSPATETRPSRGPWLAIGLCCPDGSSLTTASSEPLESLPATYGFAVESAAPKENRLKVGIQRQPFQHAIRCVIMREGNGLRLSTSPRQGCVNHYVLARVPAPTPMPAPTLAAPRVSTDSRNSSLSHASS